MLWQIRASHAFFIIRRHSQNVRFCRDGAERRVGETDTGTISETCVFIADNFGNEFEARLVRVELKTPTCDGETSIELFTNLPDDVSATTVADAYRPHRNRRRA